MSEALTTRGAMQAETLEKVLIGGNLSVLSASERLAYYRAVCESVGLNPLTRPFDYLNLNGKLVLYAKRECTEQLRKIHNVSIGKLEKTFHADDLYIVEAPATMGGRTDSSTGAVNIKGLTGEAKANALMKAETKAKRRVTLSICGLGMLDESEVTSIPGARVIPADTLEEPIEEDFLGDALGVDEVPAVDVRADEPAPQITDENRAFCDAMKEVKEKLAAIGRQSLYYDELGAWGYSHSYEVPPTTDPEHDTRKAIYKKLKSLLPPNGGTRTERLKEKVKAASA